MPSKEKKRGRDQQSRKKITGDAAVVQGAERRKIEVLSCTDLGYEAPDEFYKVTVVKCAREGCPSVEDKNGEFKCFKACGRLCGTRYCSRECQVVDWKKGKHKKLCPLIKEIEAAGEWSRKKESADSQGASVVAAASSLACPWPGVNARASP